VTQAHLNSKVKKNSRFFYGYSIVIASCLILLFTYGSQYAFGVFIKPLLAEFSWTRATISGAYSLYFVLQGISSISAGRLSDRFGPRIIVTICSLFLGIGYLLMSSVHEIWQIYIYYGILVSMGGCLYVPIMSTTARWFTKKRGLMTGIVSSGTGLGIAIVPLLANNLVINYSWRNAYVFLGLMAMMGTGIAAQFLKGNPQSIGLEADGEISNRVKTQPSMEGHTLKQALGTKQLWLIFGVIFLGQFCIQVVLVHILPYALDKGVPLNRAAFILTVIGSFSILCKIVMGNGLDRFGGKRMMLLCMLSFIIGFISLPFLTGLWMIYLFCVVFALGYGGYAAVHSPMVAEYFGVKSLGAILGIVVLSLTTGGALGPIFAGWIFDTTNDYKAAFYLCAILSIIALILLLPIRQIKKDKTRN
jgi:MFS family permease